MPLFVVPLTSLSSLLLGRLLVTLEQAYVARDVWDSGCSARGLEYNNLECLSRETGFGIEPEEKKHGNQRHPTSYPHPHATRNDRRTESGDSRAPGDA